MKRKFDIEGYFNALRPRMKNISGSGGLSTTVPPHTHHASTIVVDPEPVDALLSADDSQEAHQELGMEKLARSGEQPWVGPLPLDMAHFSIDNINDADIEGTATVGVDIAMTGPNGDANITGVRDVSFVGDVGEGVIDQPRVIHMTGDDGDEEARIDGLDRVVFNKTDTQGVVQDPSVILFNEGVEADGETPQQEAAVSWDTEEQTLVGRVRWDEYNGGEPIPHFDQKIPLGWSMFCCVLGGNPS
jgi:hypothetical protein